MLHNLLDITDVCVIATDGEIGKIHDVLFDDRSWKIRYLVVDVGSWLKRTNVVLSVDTAGHLDWKAKTVHVPLTRQQVRHSPDVDSTKPVSRQQEIAMREYFGWPAYWEANDFAELPPLSIAVGREFPTKTADDPHLRSAEAVSGYEVWAEDGDMGRLENLFSNDPSWHIAYLEVKTGDWLHCRSVLVPTRWVKSISWANNRIILNHATAG